MSVRMTSTCMSCSNARYSAVVSATRGMEMRSTTGSSARLMNSTARSIAPVRSKSSRKKLASSKVMPMAANTTAKSPESPSVRAWRAICAASCECGRPEPEKIGSFWPRTSVKLPSMAEMPVWMNSDGKSRLNGLIGDPEMSRKASGTISPESSIGSPMPLRMRPSISRVTRTRMLLPRKRTVASPVPMPCDDSKSCTRARPVDASRTWPRRMLPSASSTSASSPNLTSSILSTISSGPSSPSTVRYSRIISPPHRSSPALPRSRNRRRATRYLA